MVSDAAQKRSRLPRSVVEPGLFTAENAEDAEKKTDRNGEAVVCK